MGQFKIRKGKLRGEIEIPGSKSQTLRAILFGALGQGISHVYDYLPSTDTLSMVEACRKLGAEIEHSERCLTLKGINGIINYAEDVIDAGNSGIVLRFCSAIGALSSHPVVITGDRSIRYQRPIQPLLEGLSQLGVSTSTLRGDGFAPVIVRGPMMSGKATINGADSQPVSALLMAAALSEGPVELIVRHPGEQPWVALTLSWFDRLGLAYENNQFCHFRLPGGGRYPGFEYRVPGDLSSAAFPIAAALVTGSEITLKNVDLTDPQGDKALITLFTQMGGDIDIDEKAKTLHVKGGNRLKGIEVDINPCIDAITILAVVACFAEGETRIYNGAVAKQKECNRIGAIARELSKMGADIQEREDGLIVKKSTLHGANVESYHDHRMVMSLTVAALGAGGETLISSVDCVRKTFPHFPQAFKALGAPLEVIP